MKLKNSCRFRVIRGFGLLSYRCLSSPYTDRVEPTFFMYAEAIAVCANTYLLKFYQDERSTLNLTTEPEQTNKQTNSCSDILRVILPLDDIWMFVLSKNRCRFSVLCSLCRLIAITVVIFAS